MEGNGEVGEKGGDLGIYRGNDGGEIDAEDGGGKREKTQSVYDCEDVIEKEEDEFVGFLLAGAEVIPQTEHAEENVQEENGKEDVRRRVPEHKGSDTNHRHQDDTDSKKEHQAPEIVIYRQLCQVILLHISLSQFQ